MIPDNLDHEPLLPVAMAAIALAALCAVLLALADRADRIEQASEDRGIDWLHDLLCDVDYPGQPPEGVMP